MIRQLPETLTPQQAMDIVLLDLECKVEGGEISIQEAQVRYIEANLGLLGMKEMDI